MTDITTYPLEDWFETTLSQVWNWAVWTIYVNATPSFTFPAGVTTYIIVDPWKTTMQLAKISAYDSALKTITVSSISVNKWASVAYTQQSHQIGALVRISHNYQFWKDMIDGINSKMNTNSDDLEVWKFADATARDAYRPTPVNWYSAYLIDVWYWTDYQSGNRVQRASWGSFSNATESISWGTEIWTTAEVTAWTAIWWTWASLSVTPAKLAAQIQSWSYISLASATDSWTDTYVTTATPTLTAYTTGALFVVTFAETNTTTTPTLNIDGLWAVTITDKDSVALAVWDITTNKLILMKVWSAFKIMSELPATTTRKGIQEMATDAEANTGTDETRYVNSKQAKPKSYAWVLDHNTSDASWTVVVAHWLWKTPVSMSFVTYWLEWYSTTSFAWWNQNVWRKVVYQSWADDITNETWYLLRYQDSWWDTYTLAVAFDSTNITFTKTASWTVSAFALQSTYIAIA